MKKNKVWLIAIVFGLMIITTVCYLKAVRNTRIEYANGRIVEKIWEEEPDAGMVAFNWNHGKGKINEIKHSIP